MRLASLESAGDRHLGGSAGLDAMAMALAPSLGRQGLALTSLDAVRHADSFAKAEDGDVRAIGDLCALGQGSGQEAAFLALLHLGAQAPRQVELGGKKYAIFGCDASGRFRIHRRDGSLLWSIPAVAVHGQGGSAELALADAFDLARKALGVSLEINRSLLDAALSAALP